MKHQITQEHLVITRFSKCLAKEIDVRHGEAKMLDMTVEIKHNDIRSGSSVRIKYQVTHINYRKAGSMIEFKTDFVHEAMNEYNSI